MKTRTDEKLILELSPGVYMQGGGGCSQGCCTGPEPMGACNYTQMPKTARGIIFDRLKGTNPSARWIVLTVTTTYEMKPI